MTIVISMIYKMEANHLVNVCVFVCSVTSAVSDSLWPYVL